MDEKHKQLLRKSRPYIVQNLADIGAVCDQLIAFDILTESMVEDIMSKPSGANKTRALLSLLVMRGPNAFEGFCEVLNITKNQTILDFLKPKGDKKFLSLPRHRHRQLESLSKSSPKLERASSLPQPVTPPLFSGDLGQTFRSYQEQERLDDTRTEYAEYNEYEILQSNQTESKQLHGASAQVSDLDDYSMGVSVSGSEQHVSHFGPEASSQGDINRDMENFHQLGYEDPPANVHQSSDRWQSVPSDETLPVESFGNRQALSEQGYAVQAPVDDDHIENAGQISITNEPENLDETDYEGNGWPKTRKHSRPLVDLEIKLPPPSSQQVKKFFMDVANNRVYECKPQCHRRLVIINNSTFLPESGLPPRTTGNIDATSLDLLFKKMRYQTKTYSNCSCQGIMEVLRDESTAPTLNDLDTFILVILSHGEGEKIYGTEGNTVDVRDITKLFNEQHCRALKGRPKLFFISASRQQQSRSREEDCAVSDLEAVEYDSLSPDTLNSLVSMTTDAGRTEPSNMFIARETTQCHAVYNGVSFGSQFIQALIHIIKEHSSEHDLISLMEKMNQLVKRPSGSPFKLVEYTDILCKKFYFFDINLTSSFAMSI